MTPNYLGGGGVAMKKKVHSRNVSKLLQISVTHGLVTSHQPESSLWLGLRLRPRPAKTVPFVILLSINARQSNSSRESVPVCVWERVSWKFSTTIKVGSYRSELVVVCYSSELQTTNFKKRIVFD